MNLARICVVLATLLAPFTAHAAATIKVTLRDASVARVDADGFVANTLCTVSQPILDSCRTACAPLTPACLASCAQRDPLQSFQLNAAAGTVTEGSLNDGSGTLAAGILSAGKVLCLDPTGAETTVPAAVVPAKSLRTTAGAWRSFDNANRFEWLGWDRPAFARALAAQLDKPWSCTFSPATTPVNGCQVTRVVGDRGGLKLVVDAERALASDTKITIKVDGATDALITLPLSVCTFTPKGGSDSSLDALYAGADEQRLQLDSSPACLNQLQAFPSVTLAHGSLAPMMATTEVCYEALTAQGFVTCGEEFRPGAKRAVFLRVRGVPSDLPVGMQDIEMRISQSLLGALRVVVRPPGVRAPKDANGHPLLSVSYGSSTLDAWHSGKAVEGRAVVTPAPAAHEHAIENGLSLEVDATLDRLGERLSGGGVEESKVCHDLWAKHQSRWYPLNEQGQPMKSKALDPTNTDEFCVEALFMHQPGAYADAAALGSCFSLALEEKVRTCAQELDDGKALFSITQERAIEAYRNQRAWRLTARSWDQQVWFDEDWLVSPVLRQARLSTVTFAVYAAQTRPLVANVELRDREGNLLFRSNVVLASSARRESLPLPVGEALHIECGKLQPRPAAAPPRSVHRFPGPIATPPKASVDGSQQSHEEGALRDFVVRDTVGNGGVRAVFDEDLDLGTCDLVYSSAAMATYLRRDDADKDAPALLQLYGGQLVEVVIKRGNETAVTKTWALDPVSDSRLPLPGIKERAGDYSVVAHLKGPQPLGVIYREPPTVVAGVAGGAADLSSELEFRALLRPRGISGYFRNWRTFVTFPIRFTGLRFPARSSTLASSNDFTSVQLAGVKAGVMGVLEPWNYDTRQNRGAIPWRLMSGFNLYDLGSGQFDPAYLLGVSVTLPILPIDGTPNARNLNSALALGAFWEVDLERKHPLADGNHFLLTFGLDLGSLLSE